MITTLIVAIMVTPYSHLNVTPAQLQVHLLVQILCHPFDPLPQKIQIQIQIQVHRINTGWFFLTGPPHFQYQKENCQTANHGLSE